MNNIETFNEDEEKIQLLIDELKNACDNNNGSIILNKISLINEMINKITITVNTILNINNNLEYEKLDDFELRILSLIKFFEKSICKSSFCKTIEIKKNCGSITRKLITLKDEVNLLKKLSVVPTAKQVSKMGKKVKKSSVKLNKYSLNVSASNSNRNYNRSSLSTQKSKKVKPRFSVVTRAISNNVNVSTTIAGSKKNKRKKNKRKKSKRKNNKRINHRRSNKKL